MMELLQETASLLNRQATVEHWRIGCMDSVLIPYLVLQRICFPFSWQQVQNGKYFIKLYQGECFCYQIYKYTELK